MIRRPLELSAALLSGGALGAWLGESPWTAVWAAWLGAVVWVLLDNLRARRVLEWLKTGESSRSPDVSAVWGEVVEQARRGLRAMDRKARKSEARLEEFLAAIQASPNGVVLLDKTGAIEWCNLTAAEHLGFDPKRDLRQYVRNLVRDPVFAAYLKGNSFKQGVEIDGRNATPSHPQRISIHIHPYGKNRKLLLTRDVTALQLAEAMRRDFVANVSHEIRTPLTVVSGFIETLLNLELSEEERRRYLTLMGQQADRMQHLVADLLTLSRLEGSPVPGSSEWVPCDDLLRQVLEEAQALSVVLTEGQPHAIAADAATEEAMQVAGSRSELHSALSNLMGNAVRYTPPGGRITAGWRVAQDGGAEFFVQDTGPGIAAEHLPRLTERFYRVDRSRSRETGGTGLGLAIVKHVAQRHGGQMRVQSQLGLGSTFSLSLPPARVLLD
jgi:two-component system phosphate regulon sensor histidine kinase PhoR